MSKKFNKLLAALCAAALALCPLDIAAFAAETDEGSVLVPEPVVVDEAYSGSGYYIATYDENAPEPADGSSPLLHSSDQEYVYNCMIAMKSSYPEGKPWTNNDEYVWKNIYYGEGMSYPYSKYTGGGCVAFCMILSDAAFGDAPAYEHTKFKYDDLRVGDILRVENNQHSVIILQKDSSGIVIAEGNYNSSIHWGRTMTKSDVMKANYYVTRYDPNDTPTPPPVSDEVEINATNFPDANFRQYISDNFDTDHNTKLSKSEIAAVEDIDVYELSISDLKGIGFFTSLRTLMCSNNNLSELDLSKNTALTHLACTHNQLTELDLSKNTALLQLYCQYNKLTELDLSKNTSFEYVGCGYNQLTSLNISKCTKLNELNCTSNKLSKLDVTKNTALAKLYCSGNQLTALDLSKNTALTDLDCSGNKLRALDITKCAKLLYLECDNNSIRSLDLSNNIKLATLGCTSNQLTSLDVSNNPDITSFEASGNRYSIGAVATYDLTKLPGFDPTRASNWAGATFDGTSTITVNSTAVTYDYNCGNGISVSFMLLAEDSPDSVLTVGTGGDYATVAEAVAKINSDIKNNTAQELYTIKLVSDLAENKAIQLPDVPIIMTAAATQIVATASLTAKNDLTINNLYLANPKGKAANVTAKKNLTAESSIFGTTKVTGAAQIEDCTIEGALTISSKDTASKLTNTKVTGKINASFGLELKNCSETGAVTAKGPLYIGGPTTVNGAVNVNSTLGETYLVGVTVKGKITASNDLILSECPSVGAITAKGSLAITGPDEYTTTGAITANLTSKEALIAKAEIIGKITCSCDLIMAQCDVTGAVSAKGSVSLSDCTVAGNVTAQSKTDKSYISQTAVIGNVSVAADIGMSGSGIGGKLTAKGDLYITGSDVVLGEISAAGISSDSDTNSLTFTALSITRDGIVTGSKQLTLKLVKITDKKNLIWEAVNMDSTNKKLNTVAKKFKGTFTDGILLLSADNATGVSIVYDGKSKLLIA